MKLRIFATYLFLFCLMFAGHAFALEYVYFDDGAIHTLSDDTYKNHQANVLDSGGGLPTTVNINPGGIVDSANVFDNSTINIAGGRTSGYLRAYDNSTVTVSSGGILGDGLAAYNDSTVYFIDGVFGSESVYLYDDSRLFHSGGHAEDVGLNGQAYLEITGGQISEAIFGHDSSIIDIYGGELFSVADEDEPGIDADDLSVFNIYGESFNYPFGPIADFSGTLTGILFSGESIDTYFQRIETASIILHHRPIDAPEPATLLLLGTGFIGIAGFAASRRRKK